MPVKINDAGHNVLASQMRDLGPGGDLQLRLRPQPVDAAVDNDDGGVPHRCAARAIDERKAIEHHSFSPGHARR